MVFVLTRDVSSGYGVDTGGRDEAAHRPVCACSWLLNLHDCSCPKNKFHPPLVAVVQTQLISLWQVPIIAGVTAAFLNLRFPASPHPPSLPPILPKRLFPA